MQQSAVDNGIVSLSQTITEYHTIYHSHIAQYIAPRLGLGIIGFLALIPKPHILINGKSLGLSVLIMFVLCMFKRIQHCRTSSYDFATLTSHGNDKFYPIICCSSFLGILDDNIKRITRRTAGAQGCYFQTDVFQVTLSKFQTILKSF